MTSTRVTLSRGGLDRLKARQRVARDVLGGDGQRRPIGTLVRLVVAREGVTEPTKAVAEALGHAEQTRRAIASTRMF